MKNSEYWKQRFDILEAAQNKGAEQSRAEIEQQFIIAQKELESKISTWYTRFAKNNQISMAEARQWLNTKDLAELKWDVKEYIKYGEQVGMNANWMKQLENASAKFHISRFEALKVQTQQSMEKLFTGQANTATALMKKTYLEGYYHTAYEINKGLSIGWDIAAVNDSQLEKILSKPWTADNRTFSDRIWTNKNKLLNELHTQLSQNVLLGKSPDAAINAIAKKMNTSKANAGRLVMTESAYFSSVAQKDAYIKLGVEQFEIVATLDSKTSEICQQLDGKIFSMSDYEPGVTANPFHPNCRSTTAPYFDDDFSIGERAARDENGKTYYVPDDMPYKEWKETFVDGTASKDGLDVYEANGTVHYTKPKAVVSAGLSELERQDIIDSVLKSEAVSKFDEAHVHLIRTDLKKATDANLKIVQLSIDKLHLNANGTEGCFYRPGSGYMEMNMDKEPIDNIRTFWHEYGHYIDDVRYGKSGLTLTTTETIEGRASSHTFEWFGASERADRLHKYDTKAAIPDLQGFLDSISPGKYDVRGESNAAIYLKGTDIQVGADWGANRTDLSTLRDDINAGLKRELGADASQAYLKSLGKPDNPVYTDYWTQYRTPKRQTLKTKPAFKGAEDAWSTAMMEYGEAMQKWEAAHPDAYKEASRLYDAYRNRANRAAAITDLLDGEAHGEMNMLIFWGGHDSMYFKTNSLNINEGFANWFQLSFQNDVEMLNLLEKYAPNAKSIFEECFDEMIKQTFGG